MPRQLIIDAHEWITEISAVPSCLLVNRHPRERSWVCQRGKKTLLSLTLVCCGQQHVGCSIGGNGPPSGGPLIVKYHYSQRRCAHRMEIERQPLVCWVKICSALWIFRVELRVMNNDEQVQRGFTASCVKLDTLQCRPRLRPSALQFEKLSWSSRVSRSRPDGEFGWGGTSVTEQRRRPEAVLSENRNLPWRSRLHVRLTQQLSVVVGNTQVWPCDPLCFRNLESRGDRKITTGITGLWQPSVHSDVAF